MATACRSGSAFRFEDVSRLGDGPTYPDESEKTMPTRTTPRRKTARAPHLRGPATPNQLEVLRRHASETGQTFDPNISAADASKLIGARFSENPKAARAHAKAERKRRQLEQRLINPAANWRFGHKQTDKQEQAEIRRARRDGLEDVYMRLQAWTLARRPEENPHEPARTRIDRPGHASRAPSLEGTDTPSISTEGID